MQISDQILNIYLTYLVRTSTREAVQMRIHTCLFLYVIVNLRHVFLEAFLTCIYLIVHMTVRMHSDRMSFVNDPLVILLCFLIIIVNNKECCLHIVFLQHIQEFSGV